MAQPMTVDEALVPPEQRLNRHWKPDTQTATLMAGYLLPILEPRIDKQIKTVVQREFRRSEAEHIDVDELVDELTDAVTARFLPLLILQLAVVHQRMCSIETLIEQMGASITDQQKATTVAISQAEDTCTGLFQGGVNALAGRIDGHFANLMRLLGASD